MRILGACLCIHVCMHVSVCACLYPQVLCTLFCILPLVCIPELDKVDKVSILFELNVL